jgi:hypothetical protein
MHPWERHVTFHATAAPLHFHRSLCHVVVWSCNAESRNASNHMKDAECHATLFATWQGLVQESTGFPMFSQCSHDVLYCLVCLGLRQSGKHMETLHYKLALSWKTLIQARQDRPKQSATDPMPQLHTLAVPHIFVHGWIGAQHERCNRDTPDAP